MTTARRPIPHEYQMLLLWIVLTPGLAIWPFSSAMPFFALLSGPASIRDGIIDLVFVATGFWAAALVLALAGFALRDSERRRRAELPHPGIGLKLAVAANVWTALYLVFVVFRP